MTPCYEANAFAGVIISCSKICQITFTNPGINP